MVCGLFLSDFLVDHTLIIDNGMIRGLVNECLAGSNLECP